MIKIIIVNLLGSIVNTIILLSVYFAGVFDFTKPIIKHSPGSKDTVVVEVPDTLLTLSDSLQNIYEEILKNNIESLFDYFNPDDVTFITDSYELTDKGESELMILARLLSKKPYWNIGFKIEGHTDYTGEYGYNLKLSKNRAKTVFDFLVIQGVNSNRLEYEGFGESKPKVSNSTAEGRSKNRRVEFIPFDTEEKTQLQ